MSKEVDIKILVVNHKPSDVADNPLLKPIQVGATLASQKLPGMAYYDDVGDNISDRNRSYCEMTAIYWAWKNLKADYYGLFHYRRYLSFAPDSYDNPYPGSAYSNIPSALEEIQLDEANMREVIEQYDLIVPRQDDTKDTTGEVSLYEQYRNEHFIKDLDYCMEYARENYPNIAPFIDVTHESKAYYCNMFIMKAELFDEYCTFMFDTLESFEANNDISGYNPMQYRVTGFLAERLTNIFIKYAIATGKYKVKELQIAYFENTDPVAKIQPIAQENNIGIVLAADNFYVPYVSTLLHSVAEYAAKDKMYDVNIFHKDITPANQALLKSEFAKQKNLSVRFCDMSGYLEEFQGLATMWHITIETYFRLFIPEIMEGYDKVLYLDGDMIVKRDVAKLYDEDVTGYLLAGCRDIDMAGVYSSNSVKTENTIDPERKDYIDTSLGLEDPYSYFQAGVLLLNLQEMRKEFTTKEIMKLAGSRKWTYLDQDILNYVARNGKAKLLDSRWNVLYDWEFVRIKNVISKAPRNLYEEYMTSRKDPYIIHYGGTIKPWQRADCDYANEYWKVARKSEYYELIIGRMAEWRAKNLKNEQPVQKVRLSSRVVRKLRRGADHVAPKGTPLRRPLTMTSRAIKRIVR